MSNIRTAFEFLHISIGRIMVGQVGLLASVVLTLSLTGCSSTIESRIEKNPDMFARLPAQQQELVSQGRLKEGMDRAAVFLAWGKAHEVYVGERAGRQTEVWQYFRQKTSFVDFAPSPYPYYPGGYYDAGPAVLTEEIPGKHAVFINGRLTEWAQPIRY